jgi:hypothetical protein
MLSSRFGYQDHLSRIKHRLLRLCQKDVNRSQLSVHELPLVMNTAQPKVYHSRLRPVGCRWR